MLLALSYVQVIINEYTPGQGIAAHIDHKGSFGPIVASLSLLSGAVMDFQSNETKGAFF
jgi:alkylated DNA repair dioxygenase AlkB